MAAVHGMWLGRVVLQKNRRELISGTPTEPLLGQLDFVQPLQNDDVDVFVAKLVGRALGDRGWPMPRARSAAPVGTAVRQNRQDILMLALHESRGPTAVHMPEQDPHLSAPDN